MPRTILLLALCASCALATAGPRTLLTAVQVLDPARGEILPDRTIVVDGDRIVAVTEEITPGRDDRVIDGAGRIVIPGLIDAHVHIDHPRDLQIYPLFGVTTVVNMRGLPSHLELRRRLRDSAHAPAADFVTAGDYLDGSPPDMLPMASVAGPQAAAATVRGMHSRGFDFIKVYSELARNQYLAICATARELGMAVVGHVPDAISLADASACPHRNVAHGEQLFKLIARDAEGEALASSLAVLAEAGITVTANIALQRSIARQRTELATILSRPETMLLHPATRQPWRPGFNRYTRRDAAWAARSMAAADDAARLVNALHAVDPTLLVAGSDAPVPGAWPGAALIDEIAAYRAAGLDGAEALRTATTHAGQLVANLGPAFPPVGVIEPGARADLVLLTADPREDLEALRRPAGVMLRGRWLDAPALDAHRAAILAFNAHRSPQVEALEGPLFSGDLEQARTLFEAVRGDEPDAVLFSQYPLFFVGFRWLYGKDGLTDDPDSARKAVLAYDLYRQTYPEFHSAHHVYGLALEAAGRPTDALAAQERALAILPTYVPAITARDRLRTAAGAPP